MSLSQPRSYSLFLAIICSKKKKKLSEYQNREKERERRLRIEKELKKGTSIS